MHGPVEDWVQAVGQRLAQVSDPKWKYCFRVIDSPEVNAFALPGGYVYVFTGLRKVVQTDDELAAVLAHEITHAHLAPLELPRWIDEGMAMLVPKLLLGDALDPKLDAETFARHRELWDEDTIQDFWSGESFRDPETSELSYGLAEVLFAIILKNSQHLGDFVRMASWEDAGQAAAEEHLGVSLEEIAAEFLGPGDWEPEVG